MTYHVLVEYFVNNNIRIIKTIRLDLLIPSCQYLSQCNPDLVTHGRMVDAVTEHGAID